MDILKLTKPYEKILADAKSTISEPQIIKPPPGSLSAPIYIPRMIIPPLNTDISYTDILPVMKLPSKMHGLASLQDIPENFNWTNIPKDSSPKDSSARSKISSLFQTPRNQYLCGSCWAMASAETISDTFLISSYINNKNLKIDWSPNISATYILSCYSPRDSSNNNIACKGGNPANALNEIAKQGIASNNCVDYSWCKKNENCNGKSSSPASNISKYIPNCGCYFTNVNHYLYKINTPYLYPSDTEGDIVSSQIAIKKHIYNTGSVLGSYVVFKNFLSKWYLNDELEGVYLEDYTQTGDSYKFSENGIEVSGDNVIGGHAVCIIGWGITKKKIPVSKRSIRRVNSNDSSQTANVPYWYVRNSWGTKWGDKGYFKIAMWPWNSMSVLEKTVQTSNLRLGGCISITVKDAPTQDTKFSKIELPKQLSQPLNFYKNEKIVPYIPPHHDDSPSPINPWYKTTKGILIIVISIIFLLFLLFLILYNLFKNK